MKKAYTYINLKLLYNPWIIQIASILFAVVLRIIYIKYQIIYAEEKQLDAVTRQYLEEYYMLKADNYGSPVEFYVHIPKDKENSTPVYLSAQEIFNKYNPIPEVRQKQNSLPTINQQFHEPVNATLTIPIEDVLKMFNYKAFYERFLTGLPKSNSEKDIILFVLRFFNDNMPSELLAKKESDLQNPKHPSVKFLDIIRTKVFLRTENDCILYKKFQAAMSVYNVMHALNRLDEIELMEKAYLSQYKILCKDLYT